MDQRVGITSTIPVELIYAAGYTPVDINNLFITSADPLSLVRYSRMNGFPDTSCSWICGLYGTILKNDIRTVIGVTGGDCSETIALMEVLKTNGVKVIPFAYPNERDKNLLKIELEKFAGSLNIPLSEARGFKQRFDIIRERIHHLDMLLWKENKAYGKEVELFELSSSDFDGNPDKFLAAINGKIGEVESRKEIDTAVRIGFTGVPPIIKNLYEKIERDRVRVVYSEVERQFSLPVPGSLEDSYYHYTYPYGIYARCEDIELEVERRHIDGIIHYIQAFCFRGIEDIVLRQRLKVPVLTLQGDLPSLVTETLELRIEAFIDMLVRKKDKH